MDNIAKIDGRDSFGYTGEKPWHRLGTKTPGQMTVEEALKVGNLTWEVEKRPIMTADMDSVLIPNVYAIGRVGPEKGPDGVEKFIPFESTVKGRYTIVQNVDAFDFFNSAIYDGAACIETVGALGNGEKVFALAKVPGGFEPIPGEHMEQYILLSTSHDGSANIMAAFTTIRVVCWNTLSAAISQASAKNKRRKATGDGCNLVKIRHTKSAQKRINEAHMLLETSERYWEKLRETFKTLVAKDMTRLDVMDFVEEMFPGKTLKLQKDDGTTVDVQQVATRTANNRTKLLNLFEGEAIGTTTKIRGSAYQMYQSITQYIDHERSVRKDTNRWEASVFGSGEAMRQKAFNKLFDMATG
jgi:phage/plasmid-like protein (TIGR03299 family)